MKVMKKIARIFNLKRFLKAIIKLFPKRICNKNIAFQNDEWNCYRRYKKKYLYLLNEIDTSNIQKNKPNIIWVLWLQGKNSMPSLVKSCICSIKNNNPDLEIVILDSCNLYQYVNLPEYIIEKYKLGIIPMAQFSDLVRINLLTHHGGYWCDATLFCTDKFPAYVKKTDLFVFKNVDLNRRDLTPTVCSNWFISSCPEHPILVGTEKMLFKYWEKSKTLDNYFIFHIFFAISARFFEKEWESVPTWSNHPPHVLQFELSRPFCKDRFEEICGMSFIHKLNHHKNFSVSGIYTFYDFILDYEAKA